MVSVSVTKFLPFTLTNTEAEVRNPRLILVSRHNFTLVILVEQNKHPQSLVCFCQGTFLSQLFLCPKPKAVVYDNIGWGNMLVNSRHCN